MSKTLLGKVEKSMGLCLRDNVVGNHSSTTGGQAHWIKSLDFGLVRRRTEHRHRAGLLQGLADLGNALDGLLPVVGVEEEEDNAEEHDKLGQTLVGD